MAAPKEACHEIRNATGCIWANVTIAAKAVQMLPDSPVKTTMRKAFLSIGVQLKRIEKALEDYGEKTNETMEY